MRRLGAPVATAAVVLLGLVGALAGAAAQGLRGEPESAGVAAPVEATGPADPVEPPVTLVDDPDLPPLEADLPLTPEVLGTGTAADQVLVPDAWERLQKFPNEAQWTQPGNPRFTYFLRIEQIATQHRTSTEMAGDKLTELSDVEGFDVVSESPGGMHVTYVIEGHLRHVLLRWVDLTDDAADLPEEAEVELEVALAGREVDLPAMEQLVGRVVEGAED